MQYSKGKIGRVFLLKFENDDDFVRQIDRLARKEKIKAATMVFLGALRTGDLVTGPRKPVIPPEPNRVSFGGGWEVMGVGTVFLNPKKEPQIHIHTAMGKKRKSLTGCVRDNSRVFLVVEAVLFELVGVRAHKEIDPRMGINLLRIADP